MTGAPLEKTLASVAEPIVEGMGLSLWGIEVAQAGRRSLVRIFIDSPQGVTIDQCASVSRTVGHALEVEESLHGPYVLEVSSPGFERRFFVPDQMGAYVGRKIDVTLHEPRGERKRFQGQLAAVRGSEFDLEYEGQAATFSWPEIRRARLVHEFQ